ncbi:meteorin-like protein [Sinocyclocheilus rhinocerous]|uniref:meteorin-like protein n=1 Tax=Sinocyclocheilus rhinocerous TaxID=307959 RepID=UPI0007B95376|nr:PREDICTED: meteorin-like protein [Sinocyclocheilus rhinocerous]
MFVFILLSALVLCGCAQYSSDQCNWRGSGLTHEAHARDVEQVHLRCAEGSLEWLYPTGAVIVNLRPNLAPADGQLRACIKPRPDSRGATLHVEQTGALRLLLTEADQAAGRVRCFALQEGALFVEARARRDISRRITAFQYRLISTQTPGDEPYSPTAACRPCADDELLMAICTSDFVVRGSIHHMEEEEEEDEDQASVVLSLSHVYSQKSRVFVFGGGGRGRGRWTGRVKIPRRCGPRAAQGELLFTGAVRFQEAWLRCAALYRDFIRLYRAALDAGTNPCHIDTD